MSKDKTFAEAALEVSVARNQLMLEMMKPWVPFMVPWFGLWAATTMPNYESYKDEIEERQKKRRY